MSVRRRAPLGLAALPLLLLAAAPPPPCPEPPDLPGRLLWIVPEKSRFDADAVLHTFAGEGGEVEGWIMLPGRDPEAVLACVAVAAKSLRTGISLRDHLMRQDHLEVERFPFVRLAARGARVLERPAPGVLQTEVLGELLLHGVARERALPVEVTLDEAMLTAVGTFPVRLSDHAIAAPAFLFVRMRDQVMVSVRLVAAPEESTP